MIALKELAAMLDKATHGNRDLDYAIRMALVPRNERTGEDIPYSSSIDAALALVERLLTGWRTHMRELDDGTWEVDLWPSPYGSLMRGHNAPTAPLAILKALVAALSAKEKANE